MAPVDPGVLRWVIYTYRYYKKLLEARNYNFTLYKTYENKLGSFRYIESFLVGSFNTFLEGTKETVPKGFINKHMYLCSILAVAGAIGSITLIYYSIASPVEFKSFFIKHQKFPYWTIVIPAVILFSYLITNTLALSGGGESL